MTTQIVDRVPGTTITLGTNSDSVAFTMKNKATAGYYQSPVIDFGANWYDDWLVILKNKFGSAPTAGTTFCDLWIGYTDVSGSNLPGGLSGSDASYAGYSGGTAAVSVVQLFPIGRMYLDANVGPQYENVAVITPAARYGYIVWLNASGQTTTNVDGDNQIRLCPVTSRIEAAV